MMNKVSMAFVKEKKIFEDRKNTKNFIFIQITNKLHDSPIDAK